MLSVFTWAPLLCSNGFQGIAVGGVGCGPAYAFPATEDGGHTGQAVAQMRLHWDHTDSQAASNLPGPRHSQQLKRNREAARGAGNIPGLERRSRVTVGGHSTWVSSACEIEMGWGAE